MERHPGGADGAYLDTARPHFLDHISSIDFSQTYHLLEFTKLLEQTLEYLAEHCPYHEEMYYIFNHWLSMCQMELLRSWDFDDKELVVSFVQSLNGRYAPLIHRPGDTEVTR